MKEKMKPFCKNEVIPGPDSPGEAAGTPGDISSALPHEAQSLGADHFHSGCQQSWGFLEDQEVKFLRGWIDTRQRTREDNCQQWPSTVFHFDS